MELDLERQPRLVCGVSDSVGARVAIEYSEMLSDMLGAELVLVHVAERSTLLFEQAGKALAAGAPGRVGLGDKVARLVDAAVEEEASLLLVGWSPRRIRSGRLERRLMRRSPCPVVLVPHGRTSL